MREVIPIRLSAMASVVLALAIASIVSAQTPSAKQKFKWIFQGQADNTAESAWASEHRNFGDMIKSATKGQVEITYVSGICPDNQVLDTVKARKLNLGFMGVHYKPEMALMNFPSLPIVPNDRLPQILAVLKPEFDEIWQKQWGVKLLAFGYYLPQLLYTANPANTVEGLKGQRIRQFGPALIDLYARAGGTPVDIPNIHLVQQNLVEGKLDGAQGALPAYVNWGWAQRLKYISSWPLGSVYMALVINLDDWKSCHRTCRQRF